MADQEAVSEGDQVSDKVALVRLRAKNDEYDRAMQRSKKVTEDLAATGARFDGYGQKLNQVGSTLNRNVTLPIVAVGAASYKLASDFNTTFTRMATLAGVPVPELAKLKQSVLDLAGETGRSPQDLAEALYQIESSGVPASKAMDILSASAKASALGMGDATGIADALTSVINTYGTQNISAAQAADQLAAAVKAGKGEASEFAPQLGSLLPLAHQLGLEFDQTVGSLAFLTRTSGDAAQSSTMLEGVLRAIVKPTQQGRDALESVGITVEQLQKTVSEQGLPAGLKLIQDGFAGNSQAMGQFFEDSQGYIGYQTLMNRGGKDWSQTLTEVANSQGLVNAGMETLQQTPEFKAQQAMSQLHASAIELGTALAPTFATVAHLVSGLVSAFSGLPAPVQNTLLVLAGFGAVLGPVVSFAGSASTAIAGLMRVMDAKQLDSFRLGLMGVTGEGAGAANALGSLLGSTLPLSMAMGMAGGAIAGAGLILWDMSAKAERAEHAVASLREEAERTGKSIDETFRIQMAKLLAGIKGGFDVGSSDNALRKELDKAGIGADELYKKLQLPKKEWDEFVRQLARGTGNTAVAQGLTEDLNQLRSATGKAGDQQAQADLIAKQLGVDLSGQAGSATTAAGAQDQLKSSTQSTADAISSEVDAVKSKIDASMQAVASDQAVVDAVVAVGKAHQSTEAAERSMAEAAKGTADARKAEATARRGEAEAARSTVDALKAEEQARKDLGKAQQNEASLEAALAQAKIEATGNSDSMRAAVKRQDDAEANLTDKLKEQKLAQESLTQARVDATERLDDMNRAARGDVLSEEGAKLALLRAQERQRNLGKNADGTPSTDPVSDLDRAEAALAVEQAQLAVADATDRREQSAADLAKAEQAGVEGSTEVVAANGRIADAATGVSDARDEQAAAAANVAQVQEDADKKVTDAEAALADAHDRTALAADAVAAAGQRVADSRQGQIDAADRTRDAHDGVTAAMQREEDAKGAYLEAKDAEKKANDAVKDAIWGQIWAHYAAEAAAGKNASAVHTVAGKIREFVKTIDPNSPLAKELLDRANDLDKIAGDWAIRLVFSAVSDAGTAITADMNAILTAAVGTRAKGGPVKKGHPYLVGEEGPELLVPDSNGQIMTATETAAMRIGFSSPGMHYAGHADPQITWGNKPAGNLPSTSEGDAMFKDMAAWAGTHNPVGMDPWHGSPAPTAGGSGAYDGDRLAKQIAFELALALPDRVLINAPIDARGMSAGSASTLVGVELAERVRTGSTTGKR